MDCDITARRATTRRDTLVRALWICLIATSCAWPDYCAGQCVNGRCYQWRPARSAGSYGHGAARVWRDGTGQVVADHPSIQRALAAINADRARNGRAALVLDPQMCLLAQRHSERMEVSWMHHSSLGYMEAIFQGPASPEACVNGWVYSQAHHGIMLSGSRCGIGYSSWRGRRSWTLIVR